VLRTRWGVLAVAGDELVLAGPGRNLTLLNALSHSERTYRWPTLLTGLRTPAVDPAGRFIALAFGDPAWGARQALDVWILDTRSGKLSQLPGMPAFVSLKFTALAWSEDGRLVLLARSSGKSVVAVWRPGNKRLALKTVAAETTGSFAPLR
jgi:hypothetical protein